MLVDLAVFLLLVICALLAMIRIMRARLVPGASLEDRPRLPAQVVKGTILETFPQNAREDLSRRRLRARYQGQGAWTETHSRVRRPPPMNSKEKPVWDVHEELACVSPAYEAAHLEEVWLNALGGAPTP